MAIISFYPFSSDWTDVVWWYNWTATWSPVLSSKHIFWSNWFTFDWTVNKYFTTADASSKFSWKSNASIETYIYQTSLLDTTSANIYNTGSSSLWLWSYSWLSWNNWFWVYTTSWTFCNAASVFPINKYCHIIWTYDGSNIRIYIDWVLSNTTSKSWNISAPSSTWNIWALPWVSWKAPTWDIIFIKSYNETLLWWNIKNKYAYIKWFI